ncbi:MAG: hypothetical protein QM640_00130 [Niabella sp.]
MKKIILLAGAFCMAGFVSHAQTQKGWYIIGGSIANIGGNTNEKSFNLSINPKAAWFIKDNFAVGGQVTLGFDAGRGRGPNINYSIGPMARYYFTNEQVSLVKNTVFFAEANAGIGGVNGGGESTNGFDAGIGPGLAYFVTDNVALEALAKANVTTGFGSNGVAFKPNLSIGFQIHLPGSKIQAIRSDFK